MEHSWLWWVEMEHSWLCWVAKEHSWLWWVAINGTFLTVMGGNQWNILDCDGWQLMEHSWLWWLAMEHTWLWWVAVNGTFLTVMVSNGTYLTVMGGKGTFLTVMGGKGTFLTVLCHEIQIYTGDRVDSKSRLGTVLNPSRDWDIVDPEVTGHGGSQDRKGGWRGWGWGLVLHCPCGKLASRELVWPSGKALGW